MRKKVLIAIAGFFYYSGLVALARWWTRMAGPRVVILNYHTAQGGNLLPHILYLRRHYRIEHVEDALAELYGSSEMHKNGSTRSDSRTRLAITFDDGYVDNYLYARQLAHDYCIPMTIYLVPGYIESGQRFWWFEGESMSRQARVQQAGLAGHTFDMTRNDERAAVAQLIDQRARFARSVQEREEFLCTARQALDVPVVSETQDRDWERLPMNWEQVLEMEREGWISFGAHTMHHPILSYVSDPDEMRNEICQCKEVLEQRLGHPVRTFAYPIGQMQHIDTTVVQAVRDAGYAWALTTAYGINTSASDPYRLSRVETDVDQHWLVIAAEAAGLWGFFARLRWLPFIRKNFTNSRPTTVL